MNDINNKDLKTADYTRRAIKKYENTKDKITIIAEKGTKERIKAKHGNISLSKYINDLINRDLNEKPETKKPAPASVDLDDPANVFENYKS